jgi:hypothetical protein
VPYISMNFLFKKFSARFDAFSYIASISGRIKLPSSSSSSDSSGSSSSSSLDEELSSSFLVSPSLLLILESINVCSLGSSSIS